MFLFSKIIQHKQLFRRIAMVFLFGNSGTKFSNYRFITSPFTIFQIIRRTLYRIHRNIQRYIKLTNKPFCPFTSNAIYLLSHSLRVRYQHSTSSTTGKNKVCTTQIQSCQQFINHMFHHNFQVKRTRTQHFQSA